MTDHPRPDEAVELSTSAWAVLGVVSDAPAHGFVVSRALGADGWLGHVWTVPRPVVYRELKKLTGLGLIKVGERQPSETGPDRTVMIMTATGRTALKRWLADPVDHVREVRALLLLKLALLDRRGADLSPLLRTQRARLRPHLTALEQHAEDLAGFESVLAQWRLASTRATVAFLDAALAGRSGH